MILDDDHHHGVKVIAVVYCFVSPDSCIRSHAEEEELGNDDDGHDEDEEDDDVNVDDLSTSFSCSCSCWFFVIFCSS